MKVVNLLTALVSTWFGRLLSVFLLILLCYSYYVWNEKQNTFIKDFKGFVDNKYPITVHIRSLNGNLNGTYYYDKYKKPIILSGKINDDKIYFKGFRNNVQLDIFDGLISDNEISGTLTSLTKDKVYSFNLKSTTFNNHSIWDHPIMLVFIVLLFISVIVFSKNRTRFKSQNQIFDKPSITSISSFNKSTSINGSQDLGNNSIEDFKQMGYDFEKYVVELFPKEYYELINWQSDKFHKGIYPTSNLNPDLLYKRKNTKNSKNTFAIECKFRSSINSGSIKIAEEYKLKQYLDFGKEKSIPIFIALGIGGLPSEPLHVFIFPLNDQTKSIIKQDEFMKFRLKRKYLYYDPDSQDLR